MIYVKGDLLKLADEGHFDIIVHGCNCFNAMGGGIARTIAQKYPEAARVDGCTKKGDRTKLGTYTLSNAPINSSKNFPYDEFLIINAYTQFTVSREKDVFEYDAFEKILNNLALNYPKSRFGFPLIGCGLAGGDKERIMNLIKVHLADKIEGTVTIVEFENK